MTKPIVINTDLPTDILSLICDYASYKFKNIYTYKKSNKLKVKFIERCDMCNLKLNRKNMIHRPLIQVRPSSYIQHITFDDFYNSEFNCDPYSSMRICKYWPCWAKLYDLIQQNDHSLHTVNEFFSADIKIRQTDFGYKQLVFCFIKYIWKVDICHLLHPKGCETENNL